MSRLAQALREIDTKERVALRQPMQYTRIEETFSAAKPLLGEQRRYKITATFSTDVLLHGSMNESGRDYEAIKLAKNRVLNEVFGEYLDPLYEAMHAIDKGELQRANSLLKAIVHNFADPTPFKESV